MKGCINGEIVELTKEEIAELKNVEVDPIPTTEARLKALEMAFVDLAIQQAGVTSDE